LLRTNGPHPDFQDEHLVNIRFDQVCLTSHEEGKFDH